MSIDAAGLREAMIRRLQRRTATTGEITLPAVPGMLDEYVSMCDTLFAALGRKFSTADLDQLRSLLGGELTKAFSASNRSNIVISYDASVAAALNYFIKPQVPTAEQANERGVETRKPPPLGTAPDARVWALTSETVNPRNFRVLDIGGGTGRNALALAARGHPVDVVELTPKFAEFIRSEASRKRLPIRVIDRDVFEAMTDLETDYKLILLSEVVSGFRSTEQLRAIFELAATCLTTGGHLVFNTFVPRPGYTPDDAARELGQQVYTTVFTEDEVYAAAAGLPLQLVGNDSVYQYEKAHLPADSWPPTGWYPEWVSGLDLFDMPLDQSPVEMRWLVYQKRR